MHDNANKLRCFVIAPIGKPESTERRKSDAVMGLIRKAAAEAKVPRKPKLHPYRGEESRLDGDVLRHIVKAILDDALIICILFDMKAEREEGREIHNPNVYFELGIAETLGRPVILLKEEGYQAPFDVKMFRNVSYSRRLYEAGTDEDAKKTLVADFKGFLLEQAPVCKVPFDLRNVSPPARTFPLDRFNYLEYPDWSRMLLDAEKEIWLAGTSLWELIQPAKNAFQEPVVDKRGKGTGRYQPCHLMRLLWTAFLRGRHVNILTMDEQSPCLAGMMKAIGTRAGDVMLQQAQQDIVKTHEHLAGELEAMAEEFASSTAVGMQKLMRPGGVIRITKVQKRALTCRVTMTDKIGYVTPIFFSRTDFNTGPSFRVTPKSKFETRDQGNNVYSSVCLYQEVLNDLRLHMEENPSFELHSEQLRNGPHA